MANNNAITVYVTRYHVVGHEQWIVVVGYGIVCYGVALQQWAITHREYAPYLSWRCRPKLMHEEGFGIACSP